jgi:quinol monooxygenase YgiN
MYTSGVFIVKKGREDEFARRWQQGADSSVLEFPDVTFALLRDEENPQRFFSMGSGWRNVEEIERSRSTPGYQDAMGALWRTLDSGEITTLKLVAEVS